MACAEYVIDKCCNYARIKDESRQGVCIRNGLICPFENHSTEMLNCINYNFIGDSIINNIETIDITNLSDKHKEEIKNLVDKFKKEDTETWVDNFIKWNAAEGLERDMLRDRLTKLAQELISRLSDNSNEDSITSIDLAKVKDTLYKMGINV